jgi:hypothetical protein
LLARDKALETVSQEMGHFRPEITEAYLRWKKASFILRYTVCHLDEGEILVLYTTGLFVARTFLSSEWHMKLQPILKTA